MSRQDDDARAAAWAQLEEDIIRCRACPRLVEHRERVAREKRRMYRDETYWGKPVPGFGDPEARLWIVGLAPAAHGANRTGRMFTGDRSGEWLFRALHRAGFANQPTSVSRDDGLQLRDAFVSSPVRCAPPDNRPSREELLRCRGFMLREAQLLRCVRVVVALGRFGTDAFLGLLREMGARPAPVVFGHARRHDLGPGLPVLVTSYHPSQQNTQTGRLTEEMFDRVFALAREILAEDDAATPPPVETPRRLKTREG